MCDVGILRPYITDHNAIGCILKNITLNKRTHTVLYATFQIKTFLNLKNECKKNLGKIIIILVRRKHRHTFFHTLIGYYFKEMFNKLSQSHIKTVTHG